LVKQNGTETTTESKKLVDTYEEIESPILCNLTTIEFNLSTFDGKKVDDPIQRGGR